MRGANKRRKIAMTETRPPPLPSSATSENNGSLSRIETLTRTRPRETIASTAPRRLDTLPAETQQLIYIYAIESSKSTQSGVILATPEETLRHLFHVSYRVRAHLIEAIKAYGGKYLDACIRSEVYTWEFNMKYGIT
jgi:hypothetical protein